VGGWPIGTSKRRQSEETAGFDGGGKILPHQMY
jgi:hypothetical protein